MKRLFLLVGFLLFICPPSSAIDVQDLLGTDANGGTATGLDRIRNVIGQDQNAMGDPFLQGINPGGVHSSSPLKAIMDDFITKGLASPYIQDTSDGEDDGTSDGDLPFFSGDGNDLVTGPEEAGGEWSAWPDDNWGWFYYPSGDDVWFNPWFWSEE